MENELETALRTARKYEHLVVNEIGPLARAFLSLHARVVEVERERDAARKEVDAEVDTRLYWERRFEEEKQSRIAAESRLAQARVEGAREALWKLYNVGHLGKTSVWFEGEMTRDDLRRYIKQHYPAAAPVPETRTDDADACVCGHHRSDHYGYTGGKFACCADRLNCPCVDFRPAVAPEPPRVNLTPDEVRERIAALPKIELRGDASAEGVYVRRTDVLYTLLSRPTASGEG